MERGLHNAVAMRIIILSLIINAAALLCAGADFDAGLKAYQAHDYSTALDNWLPLAQNGAPHAQYNLGLMYAHGDGVPKDMAQAAAWYRKAADQGIVQAQFNLALLYSQGDGVPRSLDDAREWFVKAADQGDPRATYALANLYSDEGQAQNYPEALKLYQKGAEGGSASAQFELGVIYDLGHGVPSDFAQAEKWYRQAAEQGYAPALTNLGVLYYNGQGEKRDLVLAHEYFLLGQMRGDPRAANLIECTNNKLTKNEMKRATELAQQWVSSHASALQLARAQGQ